MTSYTSFEELEAAVPLSQLRPSVAFSRCAAHLPHDVDQLHGDELVQSLEQALTIHSKARVVLQCWVLLIMRRRVEARHEKDALYDRLQQTPVSPQEKIRYRRGAMLLCHLLIEREIAEETSLLDRYLVEYYFPWSSAVNCREDAFYLQANVIDWVRQALDYIQQNGSKITAMKWLDRDRPKPAATPLVLMPTNSAQNVQTDPTVEAAPATRLCRSQKVSQPNPHPACPPSAAPKKRRRTGSDNTRRELDTLKEVVGRWAKQLHHQLLQAARSGNKAEILRIADELQVPPFMSGGAGAVVAAHTTDEGESADDCETDSDEAAKCVSEDEDSSSPGSPAEECTVCAAEPVRLEEVWNVSCGHGFCGECMFTRLGLRERRCMYCRAQIVRLVDSLGNVFQHYEWMSWWKQQVRV